MQFILQIFSALPLLAAAAMAAPAPAYGGYDHYDAYPSKYDGYKYDGYPSKYDGGCRYHDEGRYVDRPVWYGRGNDANVVVLDEPRERHGCCRPPHCRSRCPVRIDTGTRFNGRASEERCENSHSFLEVDRPCRCDRLAKRDVSPAPAGDDGDDGADRSPHPYGGCWCYEPRYPYDCRCQYGGPYGCCDNYYGGGYPYECGHPRGVRYGCCPYQE